MSGRKPTAADRLVFDNDAGAYQDGWVLSKRDDGTYEIQWLQNPEDVRPAGCTCHLHRDDVQDACAACKTAGYQHKVNHDAIPLNSDQAAVDFVVTRAREGSLYHLRALFLHLGIRPEQVRASQYGNMYEALQDLREIFTRTQSGKRVTNGRIASVLKRVDAVMDVAKRYLEIK